MQRIILILILGLFTCSLWGQKEGALTLDRIFSGEFRQDYFGPLKWLNGGDAYTKLEFSKDGVRALEIVKYDSKTGAREVLVSGNDLKIEGGNPIWIEGYEWINGEEKVLLFTDSKRVWRTNTKGNYYLLDRKAKKIQPLGISRPASSMMFAKLSPDGSKVAYVSENNLYLEELSSQKITALTKDGNRDIINGTFDWVYEEELFCKDGFRWSPNGEYIAFWQVDAAGTGVFYMINNTDSVYSEPIPVQYPKVGEDPSSVKVGVVEVATGKIQWMDIPGDPRQNYIPRMQWVNNQLLVQQLNRKQNHLKFWLCDIKTGKGAMVYEEKDEAWVDILHMDVTMPWDMIDPALIDNEKFFLRETDFDGWRRVYKVGIDGQTKMPLTKGEFDIARSYLVDEENGFLYFSASPDNATQRYMHRVPLDGSATLKRITPSKYTGINNYNVSPNGKFAIHTHSNVNEPTTRRLISLPDHKTIKVLTDNAAYKEKLAKLNLPEVEFFQVTTEDGVTMDGRMIKPIDFDEQKKYPVLFNVYGEPAGQTATDSWIGRLWDYYLAQQGYIIITMDNRGTPSLKGREWRKSIYRKIGVVNSRDQAMATKEILKWPYVDSDRIAVWGWSGGGSMTLNLLFRYPEIYKAGMSVAPVSNQLFYDNIYQERYMGLPAENLEDFIEGSPITYAKNLKGQLLLVHGTGDDNVHYQNAEALINELIKQNKQFQVMPYPNRSHGIYEGENTSRHLYTLLTQYLKRNIPQNQEYLTKP